MAKLLSFLVFNLLIACNQSKTEKPTAPPVITEASEQSDHRILSKENARKQLQEALKGNGQPFTWDTLIKSPSTAIAIAEPILFDVFGKDQILGEKPYEIYLIDGYWYITGTIPKGWKGGAFEVIMSAKDAKIIRLTHY